MILRTIKARSLRANARLDAKYFLSAGTEAAERIAVAKAAGVPTATLGGRNGVAQLAAPQRFRRVYAAPGEDAVPYLRPYDVFDYVPQAADHLSVPRSDNLEQLKVSPGTLLQTCSGRNLGPAVAVDAYLARFAMSHDLIRMQFDNEQLRLYVLAFLASPTGQALLRRDKTGSVIDHISPLHVAAVEVPLLDDDVRSAVAGLEGRAVDLREEARLSLDAAIRLYEASLPTMPTAAESLRSGWTVRASSLLGRIDAAYYDVAVAGIQEDLLAAGGVRVGDIAEVVKPAGRYKTFYVDPDFGRPLLSGRQLLQFHPINPQYISPRSIDDESRYELCHGWTAFQADGRAQERLGFPVMITPDRDGWLASGHVGRLVPRDGVDPGWLFTAWATTQVQRQVAALACGSVVDALYPADLEKVVLPPPEDWSGADVMLAWEQFSEAAQAHTAAVAVLEERLAEVTGEEQDQA